VSTASLFIDTNIFLHYRSLDQIDWCCLTQTKSVLIVLPPVVFRELNKQKDTNPSRHLRKRAQVALASLLERFGTGGRAVIRPGVDAEAITYDPMIDFAAHQLRTDVQDDFLLASILDYRTRHPGSDCRLVTADVGLNLKSRSHNIPVLLPPEKLKLPEESDPNTKRVNELESEIYELKHRAPLLKLCFESEAAVTKFTLAKPLELVSSDVERAVLELTRKYPQLQFPSETHSVTPTRGIARRAEQRMIAMRSNITMSLRSGIRPEEFSRYNAQLEQFYGDYRHYLEAMLVHNNLKLRTLCLKIIIRNDGSSPAEDIDAQLHFPDGFQLVEEDGLPQAPVPPEAPDGPRTEQQILEDSFARISALAMHQTQARILPSFNSAANVSSASIQRTNSYDVSFHVRKLKHGFRETFDPLNVMFDTFDAASSFQINYAIHVGNMPKPVDGKLHVVVEREPTTS
jgi:hypothetical protein